MLSPRLGRGFEVSLQPTRRVDSLRWEAGRKRATEDRVVVEEPLEIRLDGSPVAVTMRTPGHDFYLAAGFLRTEGILVRPDQVASIAYCTEAGAEPGERNVVDVLSAAGADLPAGGWQRQFYVSSSCGICGRASLQAVRQAAAPLADSSRFDAAILAQLPQRLRAAQAVFHETGALHAAALFTPQGELTEIMEDIGRHNAVDKIIGAAFLEDRLPLAGRLLLVSGRLSFEITQKAWMAGVPALAGISGASSLAIDLAREAGMLLVAFLREGSMQVYTGADRLETA
jgi:FdhD protein